MTTLPSQNRVTPQASEAEIKTLLKPLFSQFPSQDGDSDGKFLGYFIALQGQPAWSIKKTVHRFLSGDIEQHDGRFLPTSAEFSKACRLETSHAQKMADSNERFANRKPVLSAPMPKTGWNRPCPTLDQFRAWRLPEGAVIIAFDSTVIFPDGEVKTWTEVDKNSRAA